MKIRYTESLAEVLALTSDFYGYMFNCTGVINESTIKTWINTLGNRLATDGVIGSVSDIQHVLVFIQEKKVRTNIKRDKSSKSKVIQLCDEYIKVKKAELYVAIFDEDIIDMDTANIVIPLTLDCETFDDLYIDGVFNGSFKRDDNLIKL